jgi:hypothetical protein
MKIKGAVADSLRNRYGYWPETLHKCTVTWPTRPSFGPIWFMAWPPGGQNWKHKKCYNSCWTNDWVILKFLSATEVHVHIVYLVRIHDIIHGFLIWPTFEGHRGQSSKHITKLACFFCYCSNFARTSWFVLLLFDIECSSFVLINHPTLHLS